MAITLTAGDILGVASGYMRSGSGSGFPAAGSISVQPIAGQTLDALYTSASAGLDSMSFVGNTGSTPIVATFTVNGNTWTVGTGAYNSGSNTTDYPLTTSGGEFANGVAYTVDMGGGGPAYAGPTYVGVSTGTGNAAATTIDFTASGRASGDLLFIAVMTANQAVTISGWTEVATYSPQSRGTAGAAGGVRLTLFSKVSAGSETTVSTSDSGDIQYAAGLVVRGAGGAAVQVDIGAGNNVAATTSGSFGDVTSTGDDRLIAHFVATDRDAGAASWGTATNAGLVNLAERFDNGTATNTGGGVAIWTGEKQAAGATGNTTSTQAASAAYCWITLALKNASGASAIAPANAAHTHTASSPTLAAKSTVAPAGAAHITTVSEPTISAKSAVTANDSAHVNSASNPTLATNNAVTANDAAHISTSSQPSIAAASSTAPANSAHILASTSPTIAARSSVAPDSANHPTASTSPSLGAVYPIAPDSTEHVVTSTQPAITLAGAIAPDGATHGTAASSPTVSARASVAVDNAAHETESSEPSLSGSVTIAPASAFHGQVASSPSIAWAGQVAANDAAHEAAATEPNVTARASVNPDNAAHEQSASSPTLSAASSVSPEYAAHIVVAGVPTIRITMPASTSRTIATGYLDRAGETTPIGRSASTQSGPRNQVTAVSIRDVKSVRFAR